MLKCGECDRIIMDKTSDGWKLRTRMLLFERGGAYAICPSCKNEVPVPVSLDNVPSYLPKPKLLVKP